MISRNSKCKHCLVITNPYCCGLRLVNYKSKGYGLNRTVDSSNIILSTSAVPKMWVMTHHWELKCGHSSIREWPSYGCPNGAATLVLHKKWKCFTLRGIRESRRGGAAGLPDPSAHQRTEALGALSAAIAAAVRSPLQSQAHPCKHSVHSQHPE